uniref:Secreted protein n=1 Tax=Achlya hypogyna TaxID=1202772 RepID=A0A0A7CPK4_ACHHY|nr:secreted protein [Achlya hypogyna]
MRPLQAGVAVAAVQSVVASGVLSFAAHQRECGRRGLWSAYDEDLVDATYIDLTHTITPDTPVWIGDESPQAFLRATNVSAPGVPFSWATDGFAANAYELHTDQLGTQLDPPAHWNPEYPAIDELPPTFALRPLVVIDVTDKVKKDPGYQLQVADVRAWERTHSTRIPQGAVVFVRSDWSKQWDTTDPAELSEQFPFPGQSLAAVQFLHLNRSILFHGHEPLDADTTPDLETEAWLLRNGYTQAEGLTNLDLVAPVGCLVSMSFPKLRGGLGGYARFVAICPSSWTHGFRIGSTPEAPMLKQPAPLVYDPVQGYRRAQSLSSAVPVAAPTKGSDSLWPTYEKSIRRAKYIDLTHTLTTDTPVWAGFTTPPAQFRQAVDKRTGVAYSWEVDGSACMAYRFETDQFGTQLDPPAHWNPDFAAIDELPPTFAVRPLVVLDVTKKVCKDAGYQLQVADILEWEEAHATRIPPGAVVFVRSDWSKQWGVVNATVLAASFPFPGQSLEAVQFLHLNRSILFHGHEPLDTDTTPTLESEAYIAICPPSTEAGVSIAETPEAPLPKQSKPLKFVPGQGYLRV